jgi:hypothetical protein
LEIVFPFSLFPGEKRRCLSWPWTNSTGKFEGKNISSCVCSFQATTIKRKLISSLVAARLVVVTPREREAGRREENNNINNKNMIINHTALHFQPPFSFWKCSGITDSRMRDSVIEPFLVQNRYFLLRSLVY